MFEKLILEKLLRNLNVVDLTTGFNNQEFAFSFYENSEKILVLAGYNICKWFTNSSQLQEQICERKYRK